MISKPKPSHLTRWASGVVVVATSTLAIGLPLAGSAAAAATAVSASPAQSNYAAGETATINVTTTGTPTQLSYTFLSGPDASQSQFPAAQTCASATSCSFTNGGGTSSPDTVRVFDDTNTDGSFTTGEPFSDVTVTFTGAPFTVSISPTTSSDNANVCQAYTVTANDSQGRPSADEPINITADESSTSATTQPLSFCTPSGSTTAQTPTSQTGASQTPATTGATDWTVTGIVKTGSNGTAVFGLASTTAGTITIKAQYGSGASATATETVTGGQSGENNVSTLTVSPTSYSGYTGTTATYTVTALDSAGHPVSDADVRYVISGPDAVSATATPAGGPDCGTTASGTGQVTCSITNGGTAGTDDITFYVNQTGTGTHTLGPDSGEPTVHASATFTQAPAVNTGNSGVTCPDVSNGGAADNSCTIPTTQKTVTFTAHVADASNAPISGATVTFTASSSSDTVTPTSGTATTDSGGDATFTVTDSTPTDGNTITVSAKVGATSIGSATATYAKRVASDFTMTPSDQTVSNGGVVTETVSVVDQFGTGVSGEVINYTVSGRNAGKSGTVTTGSNGTATISYTDAGTNAASTTDTISAVDSTTPALGGQTATVNYITGSSSPSSVTVDTTGNCSFASGSNANPGPSSNSFYNIQGNLNDVYQVCAVVKNSDGTPLAGKTVTFSVDKGFFVSNGNSPYDQGGNSKVGSTTTAVTDVNGLVTGVYVTSQTAGTQTVTATTGAASGTGTIVYRAASTAGRFLTLKPATATITPGGSQRFVATATDEYGNPVQGTEIDFQQSGAGSVNGGSVTYSYTDLNGQASVVVNTLSTDSGSGSVQAVYDSAGWNNGTDCDSPVGFSNHGGYMGEGWNRYGPDSAATAAGNCTAASHYTVQANVLSMSLSAPNNTVGHSETASALLKNSDGTAASGIVVRWTVGGANSASGASVTNASGVATFTYTASHAGTDTIFAFADANDDGAKQASEPGASKSVRIAAAPKELPTLYLSSPSKGHVRAVVYTHPRLVGARVSIYRVNADGSRTFVKRLWTASNGNVVIDFLATAGKTFRYQAFVLGKSGVASGWSSVKSIRVHS